jgi:cobalt/nickel transport system ATP-binding protein
MSAPLFELRKVTYGYPGHPPVLRDLDFSFAGTEQIGLIGPNGSGKTTLARIVMGLARPDAGQVLHHGQPLTCDRDFTAIRREVGLLFQSADDQLFYPSVLEDVAFGPLNLGLAPAEALARARETLGRLGLAGFEQRITYKLSGGEKKLVSLAAVLAMRPRALFLDEPTNALDTDTRARLIAILDELDIPRIIISHDFDFLAQTTRTIYALADGRVHFDGHTATHEHIHAHVHAHVHAHAHGAVPHVHEDDHEHAAGPGPDPGHTPA